MTHEIWHVICGTAGIQQGERQIWIYQGSALDVAIALKPEGLAALGMSPRDIKKAERKIERFYEEFTEWLEDNGVPYYRHEPHPQNF